MAVLVACEASGLVRDALIAHGIDAISCDTKPTQRPGPHIMGDVRPLLQQKWGGLIAFPECRYLTSSGMHWTRRGLRDPALTEEAVEFARLFFEADIKFKCIENSVGILSTRFRPADQTVQPYNFGHDASKRTCLWLWNLPKLRPTKFIEPRWIDGKPRWGNQTDSGQNRLTPSDHRAADRAETFPGIAAAMADRWAPFLSRMPAKSA